MVGNKKINYIYKKISFDWKNKRSVTTANTHRIKLQNQGYKYIDRFVLGSHETLIYRKRK